MRYFEKISFEQFKKDIKDDKKLYEEYNLPKRATCYSAGYDFYAMEGFQLKPGETKKIPTGYKVRCNTNEVLLIVVRSNMGFKHNVRMTNQVGVIDSDYYNNESNEGHMWISLQNHGDDEYTVRKNEAYAQGIFVNFLTVDDNDAQTKRIGGFGSTGEEKENDII